MTPSPETLKRWWDRLSLWLVGLGVFAILASIGTMTFLAVQRDQTGNRILTLEQQVHTLVQKAKADTQRTAADSAEGLTIVRYLISVDQAECQSVSAILPTLHCPPPPKLP